ncbi:MAG TPA: NAD(P)/FAD-dependent oxidoreductase [Pseudonocardiaceae bacterium]|nr:NAD(P)/FAD-dependent oxidoreductase [Pseudonocardiaceae bacterium]
MSDAGAPDAIVAGAGLAGSLMALYLARRGYRVRVLDRRPDPAAGGAAADPGRSINLGMSQRGIRALHQVGLLPSAELTARTVPMRGRVVHGPDGSLTFQPYGTADDQILHSVLRADLNRALIDAAQALPSVEFCFGGRVVELDRDAPAVITVDEPTGEHTKHTAALVIGADGAHSAVRTLLQHGSRSELHREYLDWGYKELTIPADPRIRLEALHVWPGGSAGLIVAHPNVDGSLTATVFLPFEGRHSFATLDRPDRIESFFRATFPDTLELIADLAAQFQRHPASAMVAVRTAPWQYAGKVVLIGDAAHAVYPFYGQGMNAAFEDCTVLDGCIGRHPGDHAAALREFQARRKPHTDVLAELTARNFVELRDRLRSPMFLARKRADLVLSRMFPRSWVPLYTMVSHTTVPYADALARARRQDRLLAASVAGLAGLAGLAGAAGLIGSGAPGAGSRRIHGSDHRRA